MKKSILVGSLILSSSFALASGTYADSSSAPSLPSEFSLLTSDELMSLATMTDTERETFLTSKGITRPTDSGSGNTMRQRPVSGSGNTTLREGHMNRANIREITKTVTTSTTTDRASRIALNKSKQLEQRKMKLQKKIQAGESLTRLEKKFAENNSIEY